MSKNQLHDPFSSSSFNHKQPDLVGKKKKETPEVLFKKKSAGSPVELHEAPMPPPQSSQQTVLSATKELEKLKRFLTTLIQYANDISPEITESVKNLIFSLVCSGNSILS